MNCVDCVHSDCIRMALASFHHYCRIYLNMSLVFYPLSSLYVVDRFFWDNLIVISVEDAHQEIYKPVRKYMIDEIYISIVVCCMNYNQMFYNCESRYIFDKNCHHNKNHEYYHIYVYRYNYQIHNQSIFCHNGS